MTFVPNEKKANLNYIYHYFKFFAVLCFEYFFNIFIFSDERPFFTRDPGQLKGEKIQVEYFQIDFVY